MILGLSLFLRLLTSSIIAQRGSLVDESCVMLLTQYVVEVVWRLC